VSRIWRIRLTLAQRRQLDAAAQANGKDTSTWGREELLRHAETRKTSP
jgi:hypothetical protein